MKALYHSPSGIATARRCQHLWALERLDGLRDPNVPWAEVTRDTPSRVRAASLGVEVHARLEAYVKRERVNWHDLPGQIAHSGTPYIPRLSEIVWAEPERAIGDEPMPPEAPEHAPPTRLLWEGVWWAGNRDLLVSASRAEWARLRFELAARGDVALYDYKSTSDIAKWSKSRAELEADLQANLYALDVCNRVGCAEIPGRWLYLETKRVRRAYPVDVELTYQRATDVVGAACEFARYLDTIERSQDAPKNPEACGDYGGCAKHRSNGGPCDARINPWKLVTNNQVERKHLPMTESTETMQERRARQRAENESSDAKDDAPPPPRAREPRASAPARSEAAPPTRARGGKETPRITVRYGNVELVGPQDEVFALAAKLSESAA